MLELDQDEGGFGDVADLAWAEHRPLWGPPSLGQQHEAAFALLAQGADEWPRACPRTFSYVRYLPR
jgi:hypothetical protein